MRGLQFGSAAAQGGSGLAGPDRRGSRCALGRRARRVAPLLLAGLASGALVGLPGGARAPGLGARWIVLEPGPAGAVLPRRVAALAEGPGGQPDLYVAWARTTPEGSILSLSRVANVTKSPAVAEADLVAAPGRLAVLARGRDGEVAVEVLLFAERSVGRAGWSRAERLVASVSSLGLWGQAAPPRRFRLELPDGADEPRLSFEGERLRVGWRGGGALLDPAADADRDEDGPLALRERVEGRPDPFRWAVDQLRHGSLVGPRRLQRLEQLYLDLDDALAAAAERAAPPAGPARAAVGPLPGRVRPGASWPPPPLEPLLEPALEGEGRFGQREPAFRPTAPGAPPLLLSAFVRTEPDRPRTSVVWVTVWDPAWVELGLSAGTMEPRSEHGLVGRGRVPREAVDRLVGGFNGGFQAVDGAFGMRTEDGPFLPPVAYGATVGRLADGRVGLGTWPPDRAEEPELVAYRQNLTPLVEDGRVNPYRRAFWGGLPRGPSGSARTDRTGLCLTEEHVLAYLWGRRVTVSGLARAMLAARCTYGIALDINATNTAFEVYRVASRGALGALDRPLRPELEAEGTVEGRPELAYRVQAMAEGMTRVGFPRFVRTDLRDFFYLLVREDALGPALGLDGSAEAIPCQAGAPPCAHRWLLGPEADRLALYELSPARVAISLEGAPRAGRPWLAFPVGETAEGEAAVWLRPRPAGGLSAGLLGASERAPEGALVLRGRDLARADEAAAPGGESGTFVAVGPGGRLAVGTAGPARAAALWPELSRAGLEGGVLLPSGPRALVVEPEAAPMALRLFAETEPVPPERWRPLHRRAQSRIDALGLTRHYVQARHYRQR